MQGKIVFLLALVLLAATVSARRHHVQKQVKKGMWERPAISQEIIDAVNSNPRSTWTAGANKNFQSKTMEDIKGLLGAKKPGVNERLRAKSYEGFDMSAVPAAYDVSAVWGKKCPSTVEIRDQSDCGSCWAFGAAEAMTDRTCIAVNGSSNPHLSAADLNSCCQDCGDGCDGGYPDSAWDYWTTTGLVTGGNYSTTIKDNGCFPYSLPPCEHHVNGTHYPACPTDEYPTPACPSGCANSAVWKNDKHFGKSSYALESVDDMMADVYQYGSLEVAFDVYEDFLSYKSGVYQHTTGDYLGGHAVKLIGWGTESGTDYWIIVNSWNEDWGDNGKFKIVKGTDECGIEDDACAGLPK